MTSESTPPPAAAIELNGVSKHFAGLAALRELTASFASGRLYCILGENGAGKSTLLRLIAGLTQPTRGTLAVLGSRDVRAVAGTIGYMPHAALLYGELSAMENLRYFARLYGVDDESSCVDAIRLVGLDPELRRRVAQYSQGMRQRLSLARAVVHRPELLLLDEPFSNVDANSAQHMVEVLTALRDAGRTVVAITHQPALVAAAADEFITLSGGRLVDRSTDLETAGGNFQGRMTMRLEWRAEER